LRDSKKSRQALVAILYFEGAAGAPSLEPGLLGQVFSVGERAEHAVTVSLQLRAVAVREAREGGFVPGPQRRGQLIVFGL
jgi:hypothetical protein